MKDLQPVRIGVTQSGIKGLFTNGMLAWSLTAKELELLRTNTEAFYAHCRKLGFALQAPKD